MRSQRGKMRVQGRLGGGTNMHSAPLTPSRPFTMSMFCAAQFTHLAHAPLSSSLAHALQSTYLALPKSTHLALPKSTHLAHVVQYCPELPQPQRRERIDVLLPREQRHGAHLQSEGGVKSMGIVRTCRGGRFGPSAPQGWCTMRSVVLIPPEVPRAPNVKSGHTLSLTSFMVG